LLLSTDPAHSIADVLDLADTKIDDAPKSMRGGPANLFVRQLDAARALAARRVDLEHALDEIAASLGAEAIGGGAHSAAELMDLAPPGIDELFGILEVVKLTRSSAGAGVAPPDGYDVIIVDTAPTGHALRLLEMPQTAREWVQVLMRMLLKYKSLMRPGQLAAELVDVSRTIRELQTMLRDASQTRFLVVTRAAEVPRFETERLLDRLRRLKLAAPAIVVNAMTLASGRCRRCRAVAAAERRSLAALRRRCGRRSRQCAIIQTPLSAPPPRGVRALDVWARNWLIADSR
jgi:arsenite-transporting ATPase